MSNFHALLTLTHVAFGAIVLLVFWIPISAKKGGRRHRQGGRLYLSAGRVVVATALISCVWALLDPAERIGAGDLRRDAEGAITDVRFFFGLLGVLGTIALAEMERGVFVIRRRSLRSRWPWVISAATLAGLSAIALGLWGAVTLASGGVVWHGLVRLVISAIGLDVAWRTFSTVRSADLRGHERQAAHLDAMVGSAGAFYTAFAVFGFGRLFNLDVLEGGPIGFLPWVAPTVVAIGLTRWWKRRIAGSGGVAPLQVT